MAPSGPEPRQPHPEDSIGGSESNSSPCALALQYNKLMAKGDHLGVERGLAPQETPERAEKGREGGGSIETTLTQRDENINHFNEERNSEDTMALDLLGGSLGQN